MKKDYLSLYSNKGIKKFQAGGDIPAQGAAPAPEAGGAPGGEGGGGDLQAAIMQVVQSQDPQMALQVINMLAQAMGIAPEAGGAPAQGMGGQMAYGGGGTVGGMPAGSDFTYGGMGVVGDGRGVIGYAGNQGKVGGGAPMGAHGMKIPVFSASLIAKKK
jgi:hypothetical protein